MVNIECLWPSKTIFLTQSKNIDVIKWNAIEMVLFQIFWPFSIAETTEYNGLIVLSGFFYFVCYYKNM